MWDDFVRWYRSQKKVKKLLIVEQISLSAPKEMYREQYGEYA